MGFLYPRLLRGQAKPLHDLYKEMTLAELTERADGAHDSAVYAATGGDRISPKSLLKLRERIISLAQESGFPNESTRELRGDLDLRLAAVLHAEMEVAPAEAASGDVWAFLALVLLPDVAYWRYPKPPGDRVLGTDITRHVFGRLWWRAHLVHSPEDPDSYTSLKVLGEAAFDQIYARRKALGGSPHLVKAILRVWGDLDLRGLDEREILRDFLKRLLRLAPFVLFEALDDERLESELRVVVQESLTAILSASAANPHDLQMRVHAVMAGFSSTSEKAALNVRPKRNYVALQTTETQEVLHRSSNGPLVYDAYDGPGFGDPRDLALHERVGAIVAVVRREGPVNAERVYRIITRLAGTHLRETVIDLLVAATKHAVRTGRLLAENQIGRRGYLGATLREPDQPLCILRDRGPRHLDEIPDRELVAAASLAQAEISTADIDELVKQTSHLFGYERSTARFKEALIDALQKHAM